MNAATSGCFEPALRYRVVYGNGSAGQVGELVEALGGGRCLILTSPTVQRVGTPAPLAAALGRRHVGTFAELSQRPPIEIALAAAEAAREAGADVLLALGGSSVSDAARVISIVLSASLERPDQLRRFHADYQRLGSLPNDGRWRPGLIFVPTTLSAGEFGVGGGVMDLSVGHKLGFGGQQVAPDVVVLDGRLSLDSPPWLWLSTGMKALDHAIERLYDQGHNPLVDAAVLRAAELLFEYLPACYDNPADEQARLECLLAAWLSMHGLPNVRLGLSHAIGHVVGQQCSIPHGLTTGISQPFAMEFNRPVSAAKQALLARAAGLDTRGQSDEAAAIAAAQAVGGLFPRLGLPHSLRELGVERARLPRLAELVVQDPNASRYNARPVREAAEVLPLLEAAW